MLKRVIVLIMVLAVSFSFAGCFGGGKATLDEVSKDAVVQIQDYLEEAGSYFQLADSSLVIAEAAAKEDVFDAYIAAATSLKALPEELVNSYVESYKAGFEESVADEELKKHAESLIKSEMVISLAHKALKCGEISNEMRTAKAAELAEQLGVDSAAIYTPGNDTYLVDSAIMEEQVKAKLEAAWEK